VLLSMTGHGEALVRNGDSAVAVELRTVNNRYFKLTARVGDGNASLESCIESIVRARVRRGTVQVQVRLDRPPTAEQFPINVTVLTHYREQIESLAENWNGPTEVALESLLMLPGVTNADASQATVGDDDWPQVKAALEAALESLAQMRRDEGQAMARDLSANCAVIDGGIEQIGERAPKVSEWYRERLTERLNRLLADYDVRVEPADIVREVGLFAERSDISEELVRLRSHVEQFRTVMELPESSGRKLDFITQEMFRETNTIGSKANDPEIARHVVEIKAAVERMREMIQNIE